jgi:hypothetical protein
LSEVEVGVSSSVCCKECTIEKVFGKVLFLIFSLLFIHVKLIL